MRIDIMTLFPDAVEAMMGSSIIGRARERGFVTIQTHQIRDYTANKAKYATTPPAEAGFERTSAVGPIDASLRTVANVPRLPDFSIDEDAVLARVAEVNPKDNSALITMGDMLREQEQFEKADAAD